MFFTYDNNTMIGVWFSFDQAFCVSIRDVSVCLSSLPEGTWLLVKGIEEQTYRSLWKWPTASTLWSFDKGETDDTNMINHGMLPLSPKN